MTYTEYAKGPNITFVKPESRKPMRTQSARHFAVYRATWVCLCYFLHAKQTEGGTMMLHTYIWFTVAQSAHSFLLGFFAT